MPKKLSYESAKGLLDELRAEYADVPMSPEEMQRTKRLLDAGLPLPDETMRRILSMFMNRSMHNDFAAIRKLQLAYARVIAG